MSAPSGVRALSVLALLAAIGCGPPASVPTVSMRMSGGPPDATVTIDDIFVGSLELVTKRGVALPAGVHHISVEAPGHLPWDKAVEAKEGSPPLRLEVKLVPIPD